MLLVAETSHRYLVLEVICSNKQCYFIVIDCGSASRFPSALLCFPSVFPVHLHFFMRQTYRYCDKFIFLSLESGNQQPKENQHFLFFAVWYANFHVPSRISLDHFLCEMGTFEYEHYTIRINNTYNNMLQPKPNIKIALLIYKGT